MGKVAELVAGFSRPGASASSRDAGACLLLCGRRKIEARLPNGKGNGNAISVGDGQNGFTTTRMTMAMTRSVGSSLTMR